MRRRGRGIADRHGRPRPYSAGRENVSVIPSLRSTPRRCGCVRPTDVRRTDAPVVVLGSRGSHRPNSPRGIASPVFRRCPRAARGRAGADAAPCSTRPRPPSTGTAHATAMKDDWRAGSIQAGVDAVLRRRVSAAEPCRPAARSARRASVRKMPRGVPGRGGAVRGCRSDHAVHRGQLGPHHPAVWRAPRRLLPSA